MNSRKDIQRELELENSSLPFDVHMPVFDLPQGYFENFAADVLAKIKGEAAEDAAGELSGLSPVLAGLSKKTPYTLPAHYFEESLIAGVFRDEDPIPGWSVEGRNTPYTVPAGYFTQFPGSLLNRVAPSGAKVVSMFARKWVPYAAAAMLAGALVLGGFLYNGNKAADPTAEPQAWIAKKLNNISNRELEEFIRTTEISISEPVQQTASNHREVHKLLHDVSSSELDAFLSQLPAGTEQIN